MIELGHLGKLSPLGEGGQAVIYDTSRDRGRVLKRYKSTVGVLDPSAIARLKSVETGLSPAERLTLTEACCWPLGAVYESQRFVGVLIPRIPAQYMAELVVGKLRESRPLELQYLMRPTRASQLGIKLASREELWQIMIKLCSVMSLLEDKKVILGDFSEKNVLWSAAPVGVYIIDCDSARVDGYRGVTRGIESPGWNDPALVGEPDLLSDRYKLALAIYRLYSTQPTAYPNSADVEKAFGNSAPSIRNQLIRCLDVDLDRSLRPTCRMMLDAVRFDYDRWRRSSVIPSSSPSPVPSPRSTVRVGPTDSSQRVPRARPSQNVPLKATRSRGRSSGASRALRTVLAIGIVGAVGLALANSEVDEAIELLNSRPRSGLIWPWSDVDKFYFHGRRGERVTLDAIGVLGPDLTVRLRSPSGDVVAEDDDGGSGRNARISQYLLTRSGVYSVEVSAYAAWSIGTYELRLNQVGSGSVPKNETAPSSLSTAADREATLEARSALETARARSTRAAATKAAMRRGTEQAQAQSALAATAQAQSDSANAHATSLAQADVAATVQAVAASETAVAEMEIQIQADATATAFASQAAQAVVVFFWAKDGAATLARGVECTSVLWRVESGRPLRVAISRLGYGWRDVPFSGEEEACFASPAEVLMEFRLRIYEAENVVDERAVDIRRQ